MNRECSPSHLESGHVGGLQSLLESLTEQVVTDRGPRWHRRDVIGGVHLHMREKDSKHTLVCDSSQWFGSVK